MSNESLDISPELQRSLERFYYREARLQDNRQYQQWLGLLTEDISYTVPARVNVMVDNRERGNEHMISVERELEGLGEEGCPIREESYVHLMIRAERAFKMNSWSEHPPARTRRLVSNVELMEQDGKTYSVLNNFLLHYARPGSDSFLYSGQRRDTLRLDEEEFRICRREVILDYADIDYPTLGLLF